MKAIKTDPVAVSEIDVVQEGWGVNTHGHKILLGAGKASKVDAVLKQIETG